MCLILFSYQRQTDFPLILLTNRDEFYSRPTQALQWWEDQTNILAGKDLKEGGTWLGVSKTGRFAALTNFRETQARQGSISRGQLTTDFLGGQQTPHEYLLHVDETHQHYSGFNLLVGDAKGLYYYSNRERIIRQLAPGVYGLSNHLLNTPWPKVIDGVEALKPLAQQPPQPEALFDLLRSEQVADEDRLPDTGIGLSAEKMLSPLFIKSQGYGTSCSSLILLDKQGKLDFHERRFGSEGELLGNSTVSFQVKA